VVDPLTLTALLGAIVAGTAFLNVLITMNITGRRKKRSNDQLASKFSDLIQSGKKTNHVIDKFAASSYKFSSVRPILSALWKVFLTF
jgi:hypothetical protein